MYAAARRVELMAPLGEIGIRPVRVDVTDEASLTTFVAQVVAETGRIDVLGQQRRLRCHWARWKTFRWQRPAVSST